MNKFINSDALKRSVSAKVYHDLYIINMNIIINKKKIKFDGKVN